MIHSTPILFKQQDVSTQPRADLTLMIPGDSKHFISAEVLMSHLRLALKNTTLPAGRHTIHVDHDGCVSVNGETVFTPKALVGKGGAA